MKKGHRRHAKRRVQMRGTHTWMWLSLVLLVALHPSLAAAAPQQVRVTKRVKSIVDELRKKLELSAEVNVVLVDRNDRVVSVAPVPGGAGAFEMRVEAGFIAGLDDSELQAVVAHELGHIWIFLHHPYLHTEPLANEIASRVVSRQQIERMYEKLSVYQATATLPAWTGGVAAAKSKEAPIP